MEASAIDLHIDDVFDPDYSEPGYEAHRTAQQRQREASLPARKGRLPTEIWNQLKPEHRSIWNQLTPDTKELILSSRYSKEFATKVNLHEMSALEYATAYNINLTDTQAHFEANDPPNDSDKLVPDDGRDSQPSKATHSANETRLANKTKTRAVNETQASHLPPGSIRRTLSESLSKPPTPNANQQRSSTPGGSAATRPKTSAHTVTWNVHVMETAPTKERVPSIQGDQTTEVHVDPISWRSRKDGTISSSSWEAHQQLHVNVLDSSPNDRDENSLNVSYEVSERATRRSRDLALTSIGEPTALCLVMTSMSLMVPCDVLMSLALTTINRRT